MCIDWIETLAQVQHNREQSNNTKMCDCVCVRETKVVWKGGCQRKCTFPKPLKIAIALSAEGETITQQLKLETKYRLDDTLKWIVMTMYYLCKFLDLKASDVCISEQDSPQSIKSFGFK